VIDDEGNEVPGLFQVQSQKVNKVRLFRAKYPVCDHKIGFPFLSLNHTILYTSYLCHFNHIATMHY